MKTITEVRGFFESYEVANELTDKKGIRVEFFESSNKSLLQVKVIEKPQRRSKTDTTNLFCDVKVQGTLVKMVFKFREVDKNLIRVIKTVVKNDYVVKPIGNQVSISIIDPNISEIQKVFTVLEPYCRRFVNA